MNWLDRTHGTQFELARHFLTSMFENDMFSSEQGMRLAAGVLGLAIPAGMLLLDPRVVDAPPEELRLIAVRDELSLLTFLFAITGGLALLAWHSLFPSRADSDPRPTIRSFGFRRSFTRLSAEGRSTTPQTSLGSLDAGTSGGNVAQEHCPQPDPLPGERVDPTAAFATSHFLDLHRRLRVC